MSLDADIVLANISTVGDYAKNSFEDPNVPISRRAVHRWRPFLPVLLDTLFVLDGPKKAVHAKRLAHMLWKVSIT